MLAPYAGLQQIPIPTTTPPCEPDAYFDCGPDADPYWDHVVFLAHFDGDLVDQKGHALNAGGTGFGDGLFGTQALNVGGAGGSSSGSQVVSLAAPAADLWMPGDFTIEGWILTNETNTGRPRTMVRIALDDGVVAHGANYLLLGISESGADYFAAYFPNGPTITTTITSNVTPVAGTWYHLALVRKGNDYRFYVNGVHAAAGSSSNVRAQLDGLLFIGNNGGVSDALNGRIEDVRITNGIARYVSNFAVPTSPYPDEREPYSPSRGAIFLPSFRVKALVPVAAPFNIGCPAPFSAGATHLHVGQWDNTYANNNVKVYELETDGTVTELATYSSSVVASANAGFGITDVSMLCQQDGTTARTFEGTSGTAQTYNVGTNLGSSQMRFCRSGSNIVFSSVWSTPTPKVYRFTVGNSAVQATSPDLAGPITSVFIDGEYVYAMCATEPNVYVLHLSDLSIAQTLTSPVTATSGSPYEGAFVKVGASLYFIGYNSVKNSLEIDLQTQQIVGMFSSPAPYAGVATSGFSSLLADADGFYNVRSGGSGVALYLHPFDYAARPRTVMLAHLDGDLADDSCAAPKTLVLGNSTALTTVESQFGSGSVDIVRTGAVTDGGLRVWRHTDFDFRFQDFTVEFFARRNSDAFDGYLWSFDATGGDSYVLVRTDGLIDTRFALSTNYDNNDVAAFPVGQWNHVAIQRKRGNFQLFINGVQVLDRSTNWAEHGMSSVIATVCMAFGGAVTTTAATQNGQVDEVRVTTGVARYSGTFTPPSLEFCAVPGSAPPVVEPTPQPMPPEPIAFDAVIRPSLFGVVGSAISSTTLATITCADASMTVVLSHAVPGLTFSYAGNVLSVAGTPTGPTSLTRVVVSYIASDGSNSVRGSTEHEITIVDASKEVTVTAQYPIPQGRVGVPYETTVFDLESNYGTDLYTSVIGRSTGLFIVLDWTFDDSSGSGSLKVVGTPGPYLLGEDRTGYYAVTFVEVGTNQPKLTVNFQVVVQPAYSPPAPPAPAPPAPAPIPPSPPPAPTPAPAPSHGPDTLFPYVKVLMHFDSATGITTDVKGNTFTNRGATLGTGAVREGAVFTSAATRIEGSVAGIDGSSGTLCVEAMVDIDATAWSALMDGSLTDNRFCPVVTLIDSSGDVVWTLGFASTRNLTGPAGRHVRPTMFNALTGFQFGYPVGSQCAVTHAYPELKTRPGRFVHLAATRRANPVSPTDDSYDQGTWFDGLAGGQRRVPYISLLKTAATGTLRIGGACPRIEYVIAEVMQRDVTIVPFSGAIDELRITAYQRYLSYLFPGLLALGQQVSAIPAHARVIPWPNY